jgi:hypothetical protein
MWTTTTTHLKTGVEPSTESHDYTGNEHDDGANMGHNQSFDTKHLSLFGPRPYEQ